MKRNHVFLHVIEWKQLFSTRRWDHKLEQSQEVMNTQSIATWERGLICLLNLVKGLSHTMF